MDIVANPSNVSLYGAALQDTQIARFMGQHVAHLGPKGPR